MTRTLTVLSAGAARGLLHLQRGRFERSCRALLAARFAPVGALVEMLRRGEQCDAVIISVSGQAAAASDGLLSGDAGVPLGQVPTALAVRSTDPAPDVSTPQLLTDVLLNAGAIYCPDLQRSTAGAHLASILGTLGITDTVTSRLRVFPDGMAAMAELARAPGTRPVVGCTQVTEIIAAAGVDVAGTLPAPFSLTTVYRVVPSPRPRHPDLSARFAEFVCGPATRSERIRAGFEPLPHDG